MTLERRLKSAVKSKNESKINELFKELYYEYSPLISYVISRYVYKREDIEELTNDVFIELSNNLRKIEFDNLKAYLVVIAKNKAIDFLRLKDNKKAVIYNDDFVNSIIIEDEQNDSVYYELLMKMKKVLTEDEINIIVLHSVYDYTFKELSEKYNMSISTIKSTYYRAIKRFKQEGDN